ncbi:50S ribosomal protein L19 [Candidatus Fermentibacteria bacterium]|nr:50S ribosomal protein L19 [Candidatus Fermentibacteria bacterium]
MDKLIQEYDARHAGNELPDFRAGDTVRVYFQVVEGEKVRTQVFEGIVLSRRGSGTSQTFTVRKVSGGVGVERIFPIHSPRLERVEVIRRGKTRRSRLFYLRKKKGKAARVREKRTFTDRES